MPGVGGCMPTVGHPLGNMSGGFGSGGAQQSGMEEGMSTPLPQCPIAHIPRIVAPVGTGGETEQAACSPSSGMPPQTKPPLLAPPSKQTPVPSVLPAPLFPHTHTDRLVLAKPPPQGRKRI